MFCFPWIFLMQKHCCWSMLCKHRHEVAAAKAVEIASAAEIVVVWGQKLSDRWEQGSEKIAKQQ